MERHLDRSVLVAEHQPVLSLRVRVAGGGRLVSWPVPPSQELAVELGQLPGVGAVQHDLLKPREPLFRRHGATSSNFVS